MAQLLIVRMVRNRARNPAHSHFYPKKGKTTTLKVSRVMLLLQVKWLSSQKANQRPGKRAAQRAGGCSNGNLASVEVRHDLVQGAK